MSPLNKKRQRYPDIFDHTLSCFLHPNTPLEIRAMAAIMLTMLVAVVSVMFFGIAIISFYFPPFGIIVAILVITILSVHLFQSRKAKDN